MTTYYREHLITTLEQLAALPRDTLMRTSTGTPAHTDQHPVTNTPTVHSLNTHYLHEQALQEYGPFTALLPVTIAHERTRWGVTDPTTGEIHPAPDEKTARYWSRTRSAPLVFRTLLATIWKQESGPSSCEGDR